MSAPLCIACAHCFRQVTLYTAPLAPVRVLTGPGMCRRTDLVDGSGRHGMPCSAERLPRGGCGPDARHFLPLPPPPPPRRRWWHAFTRRSA